MKDDEGTAVPVEEIKESIARAVVRSEYCSPEVGFLTLGCAHPHLLEKSQTDDSPKEAIQAEATGSVPAEPSTPHDNGAPGQTSDAESEWEQVDKPERGVKTGTVQSEGASGPTDLGDAREKSKQVRPNLKSSTDGE